MLTQEINLFGGWQDGWDQSGMQASSSYPLPWADMANQSQHSLLSWGGPSFLQGKLPGIPGRCFSDEE